MLRLCLLTSKPFISCDSLNAIIIWGQGATSAGRQAKPSHHTLFLFVFPTKQRREESRTMMLPGRSHHHGPWPGPASLASPCQGSTLHLAIGNRLFLPGAAIVCFSQTDRLLHFYFLRINEEFPSHGAQPGLTYAPWDRFLPAWPLPRLRSKRRFCFFVTTARVSHSMKVHCPYIYPNHLSQDSYLSNIPSYQYQTISSLGRSPVWLMMAVGPWNVVCLLRSWGSFYSL